MSKLAADERENFEVWAKRHAYPLDWSDHKGYHSAMTSYAWIGWKARALHEPKTLEEST